MTTDFAHPVELRLIGSPADVDAVLATIGTVLTLTPARRRRTRDRAGLVIAYATVTTPGASASGENGSPW